LVEERERRSKSSSRTLSTPTPRRSGCSRSTRKQIASARTEAQEILGKAKTVSQKERETLLAKAREEYDALLSRARKDIEAEKEKAIQALRREAVELSIAAASRVIEPISTPMPIGGSSRNSSRAWARPRRSEKPHRRAQLRRGAVRGGAGYGPLLDAVAAAVQADERIHTVLESPRVSKAAKGQIPGEGAHG